MRVIAMITRTALSVLMLIACSPAEGTPAFDVQSYSVRISPDLATRAIVGTITITWVALAPIAAVSFDAGDLTVDAALYARRPALFTQADRRVTVNLRTPLKRGARGSVTLRYHGAPRRGITFIADPPQVYTVFATSQWMICVDDPSDKATLDLTVSVPSAWTVISHGPAVSGGEEEIAA